MAIDRLAVAIETQGNHRKIAIERVTFVRVMAERVTVERVSVERVASHIALVAIPYVAAQELTRRLQVARTLIDDRETRRGQQFSQKQRRPWKEPTAHNGDAANGWQLREE